MKLIILIFGAMAIWPIAAIADDWTVDGKTYHNVVVGQVEADRVHISYDSGIGTVPLSDLPPDLQKRFNYDPTAAKAMSQQRQQQAAQSDATVYAAQAQQNQQKVDVNTDTSLYYVKGHIVQVTPQGVLCSMRHGDEYYWPGRDLPDYGRKDVKHMLQFGAFFVKGYGKNAAEGDMVYLVANRAGLYTYMGTDGVQHQIAAYAPTGN